MKLDQQKATSKGEKPTDCERLQKPLFVWSKTNEGSSRSISPWTAFGSFCKLPKEAVHGEIDLLFGECLQHTRMTVVLEKQKRTKKKAQVRVWLGGESQMKFRT